MSFDNESFNLMQKGSLIGIFSMNIAHKEGKKEESDLEDEEKEEFCKKESHQAFFGVKRTLMGLFPITKTIDWEEPKEQ